MNREEFNNYNRGIAYQILKFKRGQITLDELYATMQAQIGLQAFKEAVEIADGKVKIDE